MSEGQCVGIVPLVEAERFGDELRGMFPRQQVRLEVELAEGRALLWVSPGLTTRQLARWNERWWDLRNGQDPALS